MKTGLVLFWICAASVSLCPSTAVAQFVLEDPGFTRPEFKNTIQCTRIISDGAGGLLWTFANGYDVHGGNGMRLGNVVRTFESGVLDTNFAIGPTFQESLATVVQADGKILVGARRSGDLAANGSPNYHVFRVLTNGALDGTYNSPAFDGPPRFMTLQPDGRLVVAATLGNVVIAGTGGITNTVRLNTNGSLDGTFAPSTVTLNSRGIGIFAPPVIDAAGRILIGGGFTGINGVARQRVARLLPDGTLDPNFVPSGFNVGQERNVRGIALQPAGKIVIAGGIYTLTGNATNYNLLRLDSNGVVDASFTLVGTTVSGFTNTTGGATRMNMLSQMADGRLVGVGTTVARFDADGSLDNTFARPTIPSESFWLQTLTNGKVVMPPSISGSGATRLPLVNGTNYGLAVRLNSDGTVDTNFTAPRLQQEVYPEQLFLQSDGKLVVWGRIDRVGSTIAHGVVRFLTNGALDSSYSTASISNLLTVTAAAKASDDRLYAILGLGVEADVFWTNALVRLLTNGQVDPSFTSVVPITIMDNINFVRSYPGLAVQNNKLLLWWNETDDVVRQDCLLEPVPFYRLNTNGSQDFSFTSLPGPLGLVIREDGINISTVSIGDLQILNVLSNGQMLAAMTVPPYPTNAAPFNYKLVRLSSNGSVDATFSSPTVTQSASFTLTGLVDDPCLGTNFFTTVVYPALSPILDAAVLPDGKVLVAGSFRQIGGQNIAGLARLNTNGSLDATFPGGPGAATPSNTNRALRVERVKVSGGQIWITGNFESFNGVAVPGIARLWTNGSVDTTFATTLNRVEVASTASDFGFASDGSLYVAGTYRAGTETWPYGLHHLISYPPFGILPLSLSSPTGFSATIATVPAGVTYRIQKSTNLTNWSDLLTNLVGTGAAQPFQDSSATNLGSSFYRISTP